MTAQCLAQSKLATSLFVAFTSLSRHDLPVFLVNWREKLSNQLIYDPNGLIGWKNPSLAKRIPESFPDINVLQLYANPIASWTIGDGPDISHWRLGEPNLAQIAVLCKKSFSWGTSGHLINQFQDDLWRGIVVRQLLQVRGISSQWTIN
jgi:holliday junction resolvase YEN1